MNSQNKDFVSTPNLSDMPSKFETQYFCTGSMVDIQKYGMRYRSIGVSTDLTETPNMSLEDIHTGYNTPMRKISAPYENYLNVYPRSIMKKNIGESLPNLSNSRSSLVVGISAEKLPIYEIPSGQQFKKFSLDALLESPQSEIETDSLDNQKNRSGSKW